MIAKRYKLCQRAITIIRDSAKVHGSQSRAIQTAAEFLTARGTRRKVTMPGPNVGQTYKLTDRAVALIEDLTVIYGTRGNVLAACADYLDSSKPRPVASPKACRKNQ
jgi:hypothetical protein